MTTIEFETLGAFSFLSFSKHIFVPYHKAHWSFIHRMDSLSDQEVHEQDFELFDQFSQKEKKQFILNVAADRHEAHHFHTYCLTPAGYAVFHIFMNLFIDNLHVLSQIKEKVSAGEQPLSPFPDVVLHPRFKNNINYYLNPHLLSTGKIEENVFYNPLTFRFRFQNKAGYGEYPVVKLRRGTYSLGTLAIMESWTWSLVRALVYRRFPSDYYDWYISHKDNDALWKYNVLDWILFDIYSEAYAKLDPINKHYLISTISIYSCFFDPTPSDDFFQRRETHPGWALSYLIGFLWETKKNVITEKELDVYHIVRLIKRLRTYPPYDKYTLLDHAFALKQQKENINNNLEHMDMERILNFIIKQYYEMSYNIFASYLSNNDVILSSTEYLTSASRDMFPRVPIVIGQHPDNNEYIFAFPNEKDINNWFTWYLMTQILLVILEGYTICPIAKIKANMGCPKDNNCNTMSNIKNKDHTCYLRQLFLS